MLHRPRLLVLDEPTASLDPDVALRVRAALLDVHREDGTALLVTSHNMREVEMLCERVVILARAGSPPTARRLRSRPSSARPISRARSWRSPGRSCPRAAQGRHRPKPGRGGIARSLGGAGIARSMGGAVNLHRVAVVVRRHWLVLWRSPHRWFEVGFWPLMDVVLWGSLGVFVARQDTGSQAGTAYLLAGIVLFHVLFQVQITATTGVMEETWTRNLLNVLTTPVTELEYTVAIGFFGLLKCLLAMAALTVTTIVLFGFDLSQVGWAVIPVAWILILNGWALALIVIGLILRFGQSAEILTWGLNYVVMALSGVFFPVDALPPGLRTDRLGPADDLGLLDAARAPSTGCPSTGSASASPSSSRSCSIVLSALFATHLLRVFRRRGLRHPLLLSRRRPAGSAGGPSLHWTGAQDRHRLGPRRLPAQAALRPAPGDERPRGDGPGDRQRGAGRLPDLLLGRRPGGARRRGRGRHRRSAAAARASSSSANKVRGVRAALCNDLFTARFARAHNDANVLSIGARVVGVGLAELILAHVPRPPRSKAAATPGASPRSAASRRSSDALAVRHRPRRRAVRPSSPGRRSGRTRPSSSSPARTSPRRRCCGRSARS